MEMNSGTAAGGSTTTKMVTRLERKNDVIVQDQNGNLPLAALPPDRSQPLLSIERSLPEQSAERHRRWPDVT